MKTCLHRLLPTAILSLSSLAQPLIAQTMYDKSQYKDFVDVKISQPYTPFGNRPEFNRYGDDGSKCVLDANGVLTWIGNKGEVRLLPDSSKGVPLFVTNTECLVWVNRFVDYGTYNDRPNAQLRLYRSTPESNEVTSQDVSFQGKEIIATPQVTTTTGTLTFVSATRKDNGDETPVTGGTENNSDDCELRFYRLTFDAGVQFVGAKTLPIRAVPDFEINTAGPDASSIGYGSDGSLAIQIPQVQTNPKLIPAEYELKQTYWIDSQGRFLQVQVDDNATTGYQPQDGSAIIGTTTTTGFDIDRALFVSNTRLLFEHSGSSQGIQEHRRSSSTGNLLTSSIKDLTTSVEGATLDIWNYSQVGVNRYFYTVNTDPAMKKFSVAGTLNDGVATVTFPVLTSAGAKGGRRHFTSDGTQTPSTNWYEAVWESNKWRLKKYTTATTVAAQWESSDNVVTPDLATTWSPTSPATGTPAITPDTTDDIPVNTLICTYKLNSTGISLEKTTTLTGTLEVSPATVTGTVNTNDGSALLVTEDGDALIWLHLAAPGYTALPTSDKASALFVTNDQAVIWENAKAPVGGNGQIPNAIVKHYKQVGTVATTIRTDGNKTLLNTSRMTPDPEYWFFTTAIKTDASTSRLTTYKLGTVEISNVDTDKDGLLDYNEVNPLSPTPATNPAEADTDGDGLNDGYELKESKTDPTKPDTDLDGLKDGDEVLKHFTDPLVKDTDGDELTDNEEVTGKATINGKLVTFTPTKPLEVDTDGDYFLDIEELQKGTDPTNNQSRPTPAPLVDNDGTFHDQPKLEENSPNTIKIGQQFSPFGNRSDYNRYGDDGSAMIVDVNGLLIWQDAAGKVREIPNSEQAAPLVVSNIESIVWTNAFADYDTYDEKPVAQVVIYRVDPATGTLSSTPVPLQGKEIVPTAPITSTTEAYSIVTSEHGLDLDDKNNGFDTVFRIYRITFSGQVQRTGQIEVFGTGTANTAAQHTKAIGHGSDGSIVFTQDGFDLDQDGWLWPNDDYNGDNDELLVRDIRGDYGDRFRRVFWVDGSRFNTSGLWVELANNTIETNWIDPNDRAIGNLSTQVSRVVYTSKTRVIYEKYKDKAPTLIEARRNFSTGALINDSIEITPSEPITRILQTSTQTVSGRDKYFYGIGEEDKNLLNIFKVTNSGILKLYSAESDAIGDLDETAFVEEVNPNDGSAVITSDDIEKLLWLHNTGQSDDKKNITELPGSRLGRTMFVDKRELVLWANANSPVTGNGRLEPVRIYHYEVSPTDGTLVNPSNGWTNLSYKIAGNFVMATPPFTPDTTPEPGYWVFSTVEKTGGTTAKVTRYRLLTGKTADDDGDNLSNAEEQAPLAGRPFITSITNPGDPDTDDDGIPDGLEVHPFRIIDGDFSHEEARLDAINRGGRLAVIDSNVKLVQFKKQILSKNAGRRLWLGGGDMEAGNSAEPPNFMEGKYHWVNDSGYYFDKTGKRVAVLIKAGDFTNWGAGQPSNVGDLDGIQVEQDFTWSMAALTQKQGYILEVNPTNPVQADSDSDGLNDGSEVTNYKTNPTGDDSDNDTLKDGAEVLTYFTNPLLADTDGDSLSDAAELNTHNTDPLKKDTDGDALEDDDEISLGTDPRDTDTDNDNLTDGDEVTRGTNPKSKDTDTDGLDDDKEVLVHLTNPNNPDTDGDLLSDSEEVSKGTDPKNDKDPKAIDTDKDNLTNFDEIYVHFTDPKKADTDGDGINDDVEIAGGGNPLDADSDTDGDGLKDRVETRTGIFVSATNTGTNPYDADTDGDGLRDDKETGTEIYVSLSKTGTNPNVADTDGDGLTDKQEVDGVNGFKSNPFIIDGDGDLVSDANEVNATPPTDPNDPSKYPTGSSSSVLTGLHAIPVALGNPQQISIDESFAPYGHRPDRDKVGDDGSSTIIDRNGVLIWTNRNGEAVTITDAAYAKTLHVSNTECLVYKNRFSGWNDEAHQAQIVIHRRGATGGIISSTPLTINGTVLDTSTLTPTTYGYMVVSGKRSDDGAESTQVTTVTEGSLPPVTREEVKEFDKWDKLTLSLNIITWDGVPRTLVGGTFSIPKNVGFNFTDGVVLGYGSDGSMLLNLSTAATFLDRYDDLDPGDFMFKTSSIWISAGINKESIRELPSAIDTLAYVDNDRLIGQRSKVGLPGVKEIVDYRQFSVGAASEVSTFALPVGESVLPFASQSLRGFSPYIYTLDAAGTSLKLYRADATITALGSALTLPAVIQKTAVFVRNPRDGSLLVKADNALIWVPTTTDGVTPEVTGLGTPKVIPNSSLGKALFVTSKECVVWLNSDEPPLNGSLPPANISHFQIDGSSLRKINLVPPIEGSYVVLPGTLSPDPDLEGWYVSTFEKDAPESTLLRNYQLLLATGVDRDSDGITDYDEITGRFNGGVATDHFDPDTDDDGLSDGRELLPFVVMNGSLTWEEARLAAISAGGRLAVLDGQDQQDRFAAWLTANKPSGAYWVGGHDTIQEGSFRWLDAAGGKSGSSVSDPKNWAVAQPSNLNDADGMQVTSKANYKWSMAPVSTKQSYIIEFARTNPVESNLDSDGDGILDADEINVHGTNPALADSDFDGLSDFEELFPTGTTPATNPLNADSDNDGYTDYSEVRATPPTNPNSALSVPLGYAPTGAHNRIQQGFGPSEISVSATWTPVLQRTDQTKWGDDGSAVYADASGQLLWRNKDGVVRVIPNSSKAIPLLVSNQKVIVWHNAFNNLLDTPSGNGAGIDPLEIYLYRATANGGTALDKIISDGANQKISGTNVNATAPITTTSQAYYLVTKDSGTGSANSSSGGSETGTTGGTSSTGSVGSTSAVTPTAGQTYVYRLTFTGDVQAVTTILVPDDREFHRAFGHGSDGSFVGGLVKSNAYWIRGTVPAIASGVWEPLWGAGPPMPEPRRMIYTSNTRVVYEELSGIPEGRNFFGASRLDDVVTITAFDHGLALGQSIIISGAESIVNGPDINGEYRISKILDKDRFEYKLGVQAEFRREFYSVSSAKLQVPGAKSYKLIESRRNQFTGFGSDYDIATGDRDITPVDKDYYRVLQISTQTVEGDIRWVYALTSEKNELIVYRLTNIAFVPEYRAKLPEGALLDEYATVEKINPADGSAVITSENIDNLIWVHKSNANDATKNALLIPDSRLAKGMFVSGSQLVTWHNAYDGTDGPSMDGMLNKALVRHYRQTNGSFVKQPGGADYTDLSPSIQGTFVLATPIFSPSTSEWNFWTIDKPTQTSTQAMMRNYKLSDNANNDSDGDGIPDIIENKNGTSPSLSDSDDDRVSDKDELAYGTDPLKADSDGDGVSDYNEIFVLFTDPKVPNLFGSSSAAVTPVDYNKAKGTYQGMVLSDANGLTYHLSLSVTAKGAFTGNIQGAFGGLAIRGSLSSTGTGDLTVNNLGDLSMSMTSVGSTYVISGKLESTSAGDYQFELRRAKTSQKAELLTWTAGLLSESSIHTGAAAATGTVAKNAKVTFQIYNADGTRATYAGSVLDSGTGFDSGIISLFARNKQGSLLMGNMILAPNGATKNKLFGNLKFMNNSGLNQDREVAGATFVAPTVGTLPLSSFPFETNNIVMGYDEGAFDGHRKVATCLPTSVPVPLTENESATVTYDRKTGLMKALYTLTDASRKLNKTPSTAYAVTVDGFDDMIGMYMDTSSTGFFSVAPNDEGLPQVGEYRKNGTNKGTATINSPSRDIPKSGESYTVSVAGTGDWKVVIPPNVNWISVKIANNNDTVSPALTGNGSATVTITVAANTTTKVREATITIGGAPHKIRQAKY